MIAEMILNIATLPFKEMHPEYCEDGPKPANTRR